jgi:hypothetical protein
MVSDMSGEFIGTTEAPPSGDRVELTDLEVIQRWSLAVRGATAERSEVVAALRADLAWLEGRRSTSSRSADGESVPRRAPTTKTTTKTTTRTTTARKAAPTKAASKRSTGRSATKRGGARRK